MRKDAYINVIFITWGGQFKTNFHGADSFVKATTVLKIGNIYKQGGKCYPQVFVKECKIVEKRAPQNHF